MYFHLTTFPSGVISTDCRSRMLVFSCSFFGASGWAAGLSLGAGAGAANGAVAVASMMMLAGIAWLPAAADDGDDRQLRASIFAGTCESVVSQPVAELGALERDSDAATAMAGVAGADPATAWGVEGHIEPALDDLRAASAALG